MRREQIRASIPQYGHGTEGDKTLVQDVLDVSIKGRRYRACDLQVGLILVGAVVLEHTEVMTDFTNSPGMSTISRSNNSVP